MAADVDLNLDALRETLASLAVVLDDFASVSDAVDEVRDAVGKPHGRGELHSRVGDFESGWNGNREVIQENLQGVYDHLNGIIEGFSTTDAALVAPAG